MKYYLDILTDANEPIAIESNEDWEDAIVKAALKYRFTKIAAVMPEAYEQYIMNIDFSVKENWKGKNDERTLKLSNLF